MDIRTLTQDELLLLAAELGLELNSKLRKPEIRSAIEEMDFEDDEISEVWAKVCRVEKERIEEKDLVAREPIERIDDTRVSRGREN